ncbi:MAG: HAD family phosphatase [Deltaproteobacteria bacterium]|nr:HAD family phosphatase [Deltaproteobacteria bacterium]MBI3386177.1 HAD family phosphatase [Deltaproteobacteria bacterium]
MDRDRDSCSLGIIFDLDGVIIDSEGLQYRAYCRVLQPFGVQVTREEYGREWIAGGRGPEYAVKKYNLPMAPDQLRALKNPVYQELLHSEVTLMPGAVAALARLGTTFPIALATNSKRDEVDYVMDRFELRGYFAAIVTREDYVGAKPEPAAFLTAAARLGLPPDRCVVIEDAHKGVVAAHRAGCLCIAVPHDFTIDNDFTLATRVVKSLDEISVDLIESLVLTR